MKVLGLDQGYHCGWSIHVPDLGEVPKSGTFDLGRAGPGVAEGAMLAGFQDWLSWLCMAHHVTHIVREGLFIAKRSSNPDSVLPRAYITGVIELAAARLDLPCTYARVDDWRREFFGFSRKPSKIKVKSSDWFKGQAFNECDRRGWKTSGHDEAEANGIAHYGLCVLDPIYRTESRAKWRPIARHRCG